MTFIGENCFLWQKLAIEMYYEQSVTDVLESLVKGVNILVIRFGLHSEHESRTMLNMANKAIELYHCKVAPWKPVIGVAAEISGSAPRLKFGRMPVYYSVTAGQKIVLTVNPSYADKFIDGVFYVSNFEKQLLELKTANLLRVGQVELKIRKIKGKYLVCCVNNRHDSLPMKLYSYQRIVPINCTSSWQVNSKAIEECRTAMEYNCRYVMIPDVDNQQMLNSIHEIIQNNWNPTKFPSILVEISSHLSDATVRSIIIQNVAGVITNNTSIIKVCRKHNVAVIFDLTREDIFSQNDNTLYYTDVIFTSLAKVDVIKEKLKQYNMTAVINNNNHKTVITKGSYVMEQCIEYASNRCRANIIMLYLSKNPSAHELLCGKNLPCSILVVIEDEDQAQNLLLKKYCIPISIPRDIKSHRRLVKYLTVFGRRFGYLKPGNLIITSIGSQATRSIELCYVPDDYVLSFRFDSVK